MYSRIKKIYHIACYTIGTLFGVGFIRYASGTFGSAVCALLWFCIPDCYFYNSNDSVILINNYIIMLLGLMCFSLLAVNICSVCERRFGHDAKVIVIDEVVGYLTACLFLPKTVMVTIYAFVLFRIFDIGKPFFINRLQRLPRGWGIMADDILAGIYSNIILQLIYRVKPEFFMYI